eukprot:6171851-Pleurochrysis_carterae.AAC.1
MWDTVSGTLNSSYDDAARGDDDDDAQHNIHTAIYNSVVVRPLICICLVQYLATGSKLLAATTATSVACK